MEQLTFKAKDRGEDIRVTDVILDVENKEYGLKSKYEGK